MKLLLLIPIFLIPFAIPTLTWFVRAAIERPAICVGKPALECPAWLETEKND